MSVATLGASGWQVEPRQVERLRVDDDEIGFWMGWQFRAYAEINKAAATVQAFRFTTPIDFILLTQSLDLDAGAGRMSAWTGGSMGGSWTTIPVIGKNRMLSRPQPYYQSQVTIETGGTFNKTGATEVDLIRVRSATNNTNATNVGRGADDARGLPPGTYVILLEQITGTPANNDAVLGKYEIIWEERP